MGQWASGRGIRRVWLLLGALALSACGGGSGGGSADTLTVSGRAVNGPLDDARIVLSDGVGNPLAETRSNSLGAFSLTLTERPDQVRLHSEAGMLNGQPYIGSLRAACAVPAGATALVCNITPFSSIAVDLLENHNRTLAQAEALLAGLFPVGGDPFIDEQDAGTLLIYRFDLDAARTVIGQGEGLADWVTTLGNWAVDPVAVAPPPGTPQFEVVANRRSGQGTIAPASQLLAFAEQASFSLTPAANHVIDRVTGCGGTLDTNSGIYTTAPVTSAGALTGVCQVDVFFALEEFTVSYLAGPGGSIDGDAEQGVSFGGNSNEVTAVPDEGFEFVDWSDGNTEPTRSDSNIISDQTFTANFVRQQFTLRYQAGDNGSLRVDGVVQDEVELTVEFADDGPAVEALADAGFIFSRWTAAPVDTNPRTDSDVRSDLTIAALFEPDPDNFPWLSAIHRGQISVRVLGPHQAEIDWPVQTGVSYDLFISPTADANLANIAASGGELRTAVTPPLTLSNLLADQPVYLALRADGEPRPIASSSFIPRPWGFDGTVRDEVTDAQGQRFIGGEFGNALQAARGAAVPLPPPGAAVGAQTALALPSINGPVYAAAADGEGGWYIGGRFSEVDGQPRQNLAHFDRSGRLTARQLSVSGVDAEVRVLESIATALFVGGRFEQAGDGVVVEPRSGLALFNQGELVAELAPSIEGVVRTLALDDAGARLFVGGDISAADGMARNGLVEIDLIDGSVTDWVRGVDGVISQLQLFGSILFVAGEFNQALPDEAAHSGLLLVDTGNEDIIPATNPVFAGAEPVRVNAILFDGQRLIVAGRFDSVDGSPRSNLAFFEVASTLTLAPSSAGTNAEVHALTADANQILLGGDFTTAFADSGDTPQARFGAAAFSLAGELLDWQPRLRGRVAAIRSLPIIVAGATEAAVPLLLGDITAIEQRPRAGLARLGADGNLDDWSAAVDGQARSLALAGDTLYVGGSITAAGASDEPRQNLAAFDRVSGDLLSWPASVNGQVNSVLVDGGEIFVGGDFLAAGGAVARAYLAAFDNAGALLSWQPAADAPVNRLLSDGGLIYAAGAFTEIDDGSGAQPRLRLAAIDAISGLLQPWNPGANDQVHALASVAGNIHFAGEFTQAGNGTADTARNHLAAADSNGLLLPWNPGADAPVRDISALTGVIYAAGDFTAVGGGNDDTARVGVAAFDAASGNVESWYPAELSGALSVLAENGLIAIGGDFTEAGATDGMGQNRLRLRRAISDQAGTLLGAP